jgi:hypothetical protein
MTETNPLAFELGVMYKFKTMRSSSLDNGSPLGIFQYVIVTNQNISISVEKDEQDFGITVIADTITTEMKGNDLLVNYSSSLRPDEVSTITFEGIERA